MRLGQLSPAEGSKTRARRIGRGNASGTGTTAGKGTKGQKARSGGGKASYQGMSSRMQRYGKLPGFNNKWRVKYALVNVGDLDQFEANSVINFDALRAVGLVRSRTHCRIKLLANGEISKPLVIQVDKATESTRQKVEAAGGRFEDPTDGSSSI